MEWSTDTPLEYVGDGHRIKQVILNLLSNAIKFTPSGGIRVCLSSQVLIDQRVRLTIEVIDSGIGIPFEKQKKIFDSFMQADTSISRKYGGSGLGLTISEKLVKGMGGMISVQSIEDVGSTFTVTLVLPQSALPEKSGEQESFHIMEIKQACHHKILLVEDHEPNVLITTTFLENLGFTYDRAKDGQDAIKKIKNIPYSLIFMDVQMPGMDGFEATRHIRDLEKSGSVPYTPIIAMTAHAMQGDCSKCLKMGMDDYISKPFTQDELLSKIKKNLCALDYRNIH